MERTVVGVSGIGMICAAGSNSNQVWDQLLSGTTAVTALEGTAFECFDNPIGGQVPDEWLAGLGLHRRAEALAVKAIQEALEDSGNPLASVPAERVALVVGRCQGPPMGKDLGHESMSELLDRLAEVFGIAGPRILVSTACAAGGNAIGIARDRLWAGDVDVVIAGGVDDLQRGTYAGFSALQALDSQPCSPYSRSGGLNLGEGAAFLVVERADDVGKRGGRIRSKVLGYGLSADAHHATAPDPTGRGATMAVRRALTDAGLVPDDVGWVNGHGTGTPANDAAERKVMRNLFGTAAGKVPITSIKSFLGHSLGASGALEAAVSVLALERGIIPPTANVAPTSQPQELDFVPSVPRGEQVDVVVSNNYAFGGNNVSLILGRAGHAKAAERTDVAPAGVSVTGIGLLAAGAEGVEDWLALVSSDPEDDWRVHPMTGDDLTHGLKPYAPPSTWRHLNAFSRAALAVTREALKDAGLDLLRSERDEAALLLGTSAGAAASVEYGTSVGDDPRKSSVHAFAHLTLNAPAGSVCQALGLRGPTTTLVSGGTSGTLAIESAVDLILLGKTDTVIVIAVDELIPGTQERHPTPLEMLGVCRPFDRSRAGTTLSSAAVALVLESRERAAARQARRYADIAAVLHGSALSAPEYDKGDRFARLLREALHRADVSPAELDLFVAAAAGTAFDTVEEDALVRAGLSNAVVTAPKSVTGECHAASGALNTAVAALALAHGIVPGTRNLNDPSSEAVRHARRATTRPVRSALCTSADSGLSMGAVVLQQPQEVSA